MIPTLPPLLGLPKKFTGWRKGQSDACKEALKPTPRFLLLTAPTGFGKSLSYVAAAKLLPGRTAILTSTKGLQGQLLADFPDLIDIRGRNNYVCRLNTKRTCEEGLCLFGVHCPMREGGCLYFDQLAKARKAKIVVTNYSYWMSQHEYSTGLGDFDLLVLDEAHSAPDHLLAHIGVHLSPKEEVLLKLRPPFPEIEGWRNWAGEVFGATTLLAGEAKKNHNERKYIRLRNILRKLDRLRSMTDDWVWEEVFYSQSEVSPGIDFSPIQPAPYAESSLFLGIPKVVLTSATVVPKTAELLGISGYKHVEYPHSFPMENRPVIHIPTVKMNYKNTHLDEFQWLRKVDQIINRRLTAGIIHTVSYARRNLVLKHSKFHGRMMTHGRRDTEDMVGEFKNALNAILVSPSMATGWDFPGDECRWQIIVKLPYPTTKGVIAEARIAADPDYPAYVAAQQLIQAAGRGVRSKDDWCETFILDNNIEWFMKRYKDFLTDWFVEAYKVRSVIPQQTGGLL